MTLVRTYITMNDTLYTVGLTKTGKGQEIRSHQIKDYLMLKQSEIYYQLDFYES